MKKIITKKIKNYPDYLVSNNGIIWSTVSGTKTSLKPRINNSGYSRVLIKNEDGWKEKLVHRLVASTFISNDLDFETVNHKDGDKTNNSVDNLEWMSLQSNIKHYYNNKHKKN